MNTNGKEQDPRWTAYALDEMDAAERLAFEKEAGSELQARQGAEPIAEAAALLREAFAREQSHYPRVTVEVNVIRPCIWSRPSFWASAAALFMLGTASLWIFHLTEDPAVTADKNGELARDPNALVQTPVMSIQLDPGQSKGSGTTGPSASRLKVPVATPAAPVNLPDHFQPMLASTGTKPSPSAAEMPFVDPLTLNGAPLPILLGSESVDRVEAVLRQGKLPARETVQIEEWINRYVAKPAATNGATPLQVSLEVAACPWDETHRLAKVTVINSSEVNQELSVLVDFNSLRVSSYRLIGYCQSSGDVFPSVGATQTLPAGRASVTFYELTLVESSLPAGANPKVKRTNQVRLASVPKRTLREFQVAPELLTVKVEYGKPGQSRQKLEKPLVDRGLAFDQASSEFRFAAAVAGFGLRLRSPDQAGSFTFARCAEIASLAGSGDERLRIVELAYLANRLERDR